MVYSLAFIFLASSLVLFTVGNEEGKFSAGFMDGDVIIGGLFPIHQLNIQNKCSKEIGDVYGMLRLEAMLYAVDKINKMKILGNLSLGVEIRDTCNLEPKALDESLQFVIDGVPHCPQNSSKGKNEKLVGVVGASLSSVTGQVASLLRLFKIPQISYGSTSIDLSDRARYDYLLRTVPSDYYQARAMVDFVVKTLNWTSIYGINSLGNYGVRGMDAFRAAAKDANVCIIDIKQVSLKSSFDEIKSILLGFYGEPGVRGVVLFCEMQDVRRILKAAESLNLDNHFRWVASDGWGFKHPNENGLSDGVQSAEGTISLSFHFPKNETQDFYNYFRSLTPQTVDERRNPWFKEFWDQSCQRVLNKGKEVDCRVRKAIDEPREQNITEFRLCEEYSYEFTCSRDDKVPYVIDAVYAFAYALQRFVNDNCKLGSKCVTVINREQFFKMYLRNLSFSGLSGVVDFGDRVLKGSYDYNWFKHGEFKIVGTWDRGSMQMNGLWYNKMHKETVPSSCGKDCKPGYARLLKKKTSCCWTCVRCKDNQFLESLYKCSDCLPGEKTNATFNGCERLPLRHWSSTWLIVISLMASVGLCLTIFVIIVYIKYNDTPVIKASGRELQYALLFGLSCSYSLTFVMAIYPRPVVCGITRFGTGFCICICYAALLIKTNRIARIFSGIQDPLFITPSWQLILTALFVLPQILIGIAGLLTTPPNAAFEYENREFTVVRCNSSTAELVVAIAYNLLLVLFCTIYAFRTRKVPENFNEARYIVFVMYTTCAIWLTFLPVFFGANANYRTIAISMNLILNATTILFGLFSIKIYIVLLRPEKNSRANSRVRSRSELSGFDKGGTFKVGGSKGEDSPASRSRSCHSVENFGNLSFNSASESGSQIVLVKDKIIGTEMTNIKVVRNGYPPVKVSLC